MKKEYVISRFKKAIEREGNIIKELLFQEIRDYYDLDWEEYLSMKQSNIFYMNYGIKVYIYTHKTKR